MMPVDDPTDLGFAPSILQEGLACPFPTSRLSPYAQELAEQISGKVERSDFKLPP